MHVTTLFCTDEANMAMNRQGYVDATVIVNLDRNVIDPCPNEFRGETEDYRRTGTTREDCTWATFYARQALMARVHQSCHRYIELVECIFFHG